MRSIHSRLSLGLSALLALLLIGQWLWLTITIDRLIEKPVISKLQEETENLVAKLSVDADGKIQLQQDALNSSYQRAFSGLYFTIETATDSLYSRSLWDYSLDTRLTTTGQQQVYQLSGPQAQPLQVVSAGYLKHDRLFTVTVAEDITWLLQEKQQFQWLFSLISIVGVALLLVLQAGLVRQALSPLNNARQQLELLGQGKITALDSGAPKEIQPLLIELNRLSQGMVVKTRRTRQALGSLAHRLKTQLSLLNQLAESDSPPTRDQVYSQTHEIQRVIDAELKRARVSGVSLPGKVVSLMALVEELAHTLQLIYRDKVLSLDWHITADQVFHGDREDMMELLGNVLDNACKWCKHAVFIDIAFDDGLKIQVEDDGPGCEPELLDKLCQRGFRADESSPGTGLGLAIVYDIAASYDGNIVFSRSDTLGGLQVCIKLQALSS
jgi:signal transduction histidine kinase